MKTLLYIFFALQAGLFAVQSTLDQYIQQQGDRVIEGHVIPGSKKEHFFIQLFQTNPNIKWIAETGFNAGHSSEILLAHAPNSCVVSFDVMQWSYALIGKKYIDEKFPNRHELVKGDSLVKVVEFTQNHPGKIFDFVFIDGGHIYEVTKGDILNFRNLTGSHTLLVVDDLQAASVMRAWTEAVAEGIVEAIQYFGDENTKWVLGRYVW